LEYGPPPTAMLHRPTPESAFSRYRRRGDTAALAAVFDAVGPEMLRVARGFARGDEALAEDAVQSAFLAALEKAEAFDGTRRVMPWMLGLLAVELRRLRADAQRIPDTLWLREGAERRAPEDPAVAASQRELKALVAAKVEELPDTYREAVRQHLLHGTPAERSAAQLGVSVGALHVRVHRGLGLLRALLPAGAALGAGMVLTEPRGVAALRAAVLGAPRAGAGAAPAALAKGVAWASRDALVGALALAGLAAGGATWALQDDGGEPSRERPAPVVRARSEDTSTASTPLVVAPAARTPAAVVPLEVEAPPTAAPAPDERAWDLAAWLAYYRGCHGYSQLYAAGIRLGALPAERAVELARAIYPELSPEQRKQFAKPFVFHEGTSFALEVADWVASDPDPAVQRYAWTFLEPYALRDFSAEPEAYASWRQETAGLDRSAVLSGSGAAFAARCAVAAPGEVERALVALEPPTARQLAVLGLRADQVCGAGAGDAFGAAVLRLLGSDAAAERSAALRWAPFADFDAATARAYLVPLLERPDRELAAAAAHALARSEHTFVLAELQRVFGAEARPSAAEAQSHAYWIRWTAQMQ